MKRERGNVGMVVVGVIVVIVVLGAVGGAVWYLNTDVGSTIASGTIKGIAEWTPENIAANPQAYLNFCEEKTKQAQQKLKARRIEVSQALNKINTMKEENMKKVRVGEKALEELRGLYKQAETDNKWPLQFNNKPLTQAKAKALVVSLFKQLKGAKQLDSRLANAKAKLAKQSENIELARMTAEQSLADISTQRQELKIASLTNDLTVQLNDLKGAVSSVVGVADESEVITLDSLANEAENTTSDDDFAEAMGN